MARVKNPLFSLSASGTVGAITYQQHSSDNNAPHQARRTPPARRTAASTPQTLHRARFAAAANAWRSLDPATREAWREAGYNRTKYGRQAFLSEYLIQEIVPPELPLRPTPNYLIPAA